MMILRRRFLACVPFVTWSLVSGTGCGTHSPPPERLEAATDSEEDPAKEPEMGEDEP